MAVVAAGGQKDSGIWLDHTDRRLKERFGIYLVDNLVIKFYCAVKMVKVYSMSYILLFLIKLLL